MSDYKIMKYDPATGWSNPHPVYADIWREYHGKVAWLFNPWTGDRRDARDVGSDTFGHLIQHPDEQIKAA